MQSGILADVAGGATTERQDRALLERSLGQQSAFLLEQHWDEEMKVLTSGKLREVTAGSLAQAAHMELTLALVTQDHGAITERP